MPMLYHEEPIWRDGVRVGRTTSGMYGHTLGGCVGLGYVESDEGIDRAFLTQGLWEIEVAGERGGAEVARAQRVWQFHKQNVRISIARALRRNQQIQSTKKNEQTN